MDNIIGIARKYFKDDGVVLSAIADLALEEVYQNLPELPEPAKLLKNEREKIFLEDGSVALGEAFEFKRAYLENIYIQKAKKYFSLKAHNEKYPEFQINLNIGLEKAQADYNWHIKLNTDNQNLDIEGVKRNRKIGEFVKINRGFALCPFHKEKTPSLKVNKEETLFNCFGCGVGGSVIDFVMLLNNLPFIEAVKYLS